MVLDQRALGNVLLFAERRLKHSSARAAGATDAVVSSMRPAAAIFWRSVISEVRSLGADCRVATAASRVRVIELVDCGA
jgi:hypothetical protein